jgi:hypothetical protein
MTGPWSRFARSGARPAPTFVLAHAAIVEEPRHATRHLDEAKTIVYTQTQGGSLTAGLVFGALGALANVGMVDSQTGLVEHGSGADRWSGLYMYQLPSAYSLDDLARPSEDLQRKLAAEAAQGFGELAAFIAREEAGTKDAPAKAQPEREFVFSTELLAPGGGYPMPARLIASSEELVWCRTFEGVFALRRSSMKIRTRGI